MSWPFYINRLTNDTYVLELFCEGNASVGYSLTNMTLTGFSGSASLNFATLGNGMFLNSIVEL
jgi:hypothetical protein